MVFPFGETIGSIESIEIHKDNELMINFIKDGNVMLSILCLMIARVSEHNEEKPTPLVNLTGTLFKQALLLRMPADLAIKKGEHLKIMYTDEGEGTTRHKTFEVN